MVRLKSGWRIETSTFGKRLRNTVAEVSTMVNVFIINARPVFFIRRYQPASSIARNAKIAAINPRIEEAVCLVKLPPYNIVVNRATIRRTTAGSHRRNARYCPRYLIGSSVLRLRNAAPCTRNNPNTASPAMIAYRLIRSQKLPTKYCLASIGTPRKKLAKATPHNNDGTKLPIQIHQSQNFRQRRLSCRLRNSMPMPLTISASNMMNNAR